MQKLSDTKIKSIPESGQNVPGPVASKKGLTFFGFFAFPRTETRGKNTVAVFKEPVFKSPHLDVPRANLTAVKSWVALEEKIVHDYTEQKAVLPKSAVPLPKTPVKQPLPATAVKSWIALEEKIVHDYTEQKAVLPKRAVPLPKTPTQQPLPAFETFTTRTAVPLPASVSKPKDPQRGSRKAFSGVAGFLLILGGLAAGAFIFSHTQEAFSSREASRRLTQLQNEKKQLEQSYDALKNVSEDQTVEIAWLNGQLRGRAMELRTAKAGKVVFERGLEKKYREELMRITVRYESELSALRGTVETQNDIVKALKAQSQVFEKIVDQVGMSALSGAAAGFSQGPFSTSGTSVLPGKVTSVNGRQGFVVINLGGEQGARSGRLITISRSGIGLALGRIDRVYPTLSVAIVRDEEMLQVIQEGDSVLFSK